MRADAKITEIMIASSDVRITYEHARRGLDLQEYNSKCRGRFAWGGMRKSNQPTGRSFGAR